MQKSVVIDACAIAVLIRSIAEQKDAPPRRVGGYVLRLLDRIAVDANSVMSS
jgi:hypothetical protein